MATILPGILESSFDDIQSAVESVASSVKKVHVDICDGVFVQSKTWPYSHIKTGRVEENYHIQKLQTEDMGLPLWERIEYQFDLMIKDPWRTLQLWAQAGATSVVIHPSSIDGTDKVQQSISIAQSLLMDVYISYTYDEWKAAENVSEILTTSGVVGIQCMTIKHIGVQGQDFDERWDGELASIKETYPNLLIQLDGGIDEDVTKNINITPVDSFVIGSAIFKEGNADENVNFFKQMLY
ncbi:MAG: hypothetical protein V4686_00640 [Patescibacteria group bacterium]